MPEADKMKCPECGAEMNHHADKIDYGAPAEAGAETDGGGLLIEAHTCPDCGCSAARPARGADAF